MKKYLFALIFSLTSIIIAQGEGALPFLYLQQSQLFIGAGNIGTSNPYGDGTGYYLNPAYLGYYKGQNETTVYILPSQELWRNLSKTKMSTLCLKANYNLKNYLHGLPVSLGIGLLRSKLDYGKSYISSFESPDPVGSYEPYDLFHSFSLGLGFDYGIKINAGVSIKMYDSKIFARFTEKEPEIGEIDGFAVDYGMMLTLPLSDLLHDETIYYLDERSYLKPDFNLTFGLSVTNIGNEVKYFGDMQRDPLCRTSWAGYTFHFSEKLYMEETVMEVFSYNFSAEVDDIMIKRTHYNDPWKYQSVLSDVVFGKNLINLKSDEKVVVHKGHILNLFETLTITSGRFSGRGFGFRKSFGYGFSSEGILKLLADRINNDFIKYTAAHFILNYYDVYIDSSYGFRANYDAFSITFKGFQF